MAGIVTLGDTILGETTGEHHGHVDDEGNPLHEAGVLTGTITGNCSSNVFINGKPVAYLGSTTTEEDNCGEGVGVLSIGYDKVLVNGNPVARLGDSTEPHDGTAVITSASSNVLTS